MVKFFKPDGKEVDNKAMFLRAVYPTIKAIELEVRKLCRNGPGKHGGEKYGQEFRSGTYIGNWLQVKPFYDVGIIFTSDLDNILDAAKGDLGSGVGKDKKRNYKNKSPEISWTWEYIRDRSLNHIPVAGDRKFGASNEIVFKNIHAEMVCGIFIHEKPNTYGSLSYRNKLYALVLQKLFANNGFKFDIFRYPDMYPEETETIYKSLENFIKYSTTGNTLSECVQFFEYLDIPTNDKLNLGKVALKVHFGSDISEELTNLNDILDIMTYNKLIDERFFNHVNIKTFLQTPSSVKSALKDAPQSQLQIIFKIIPLEKIATMSEIETLSILSHTENFDTLLSKWDFVKIDDLAKLNTEQISKVARLYNLFQYSNIKYFAKSWHELVTLIDTHSIEELENNKKNLNKLIKIKPEILSKFALLSATEADKVLKEIDQLLEYLDRNDSNTIESWLSDSSNTKDKKKWTRF